MTKIKSEAIEHAVRKNGADFDKWIESTPDRVADIKILREATKRITYSMVEKASD